MSKKKKEQKKKSASASDIPVKPASELIGELDPRSLDELLNRMATPSYNRNRKSEGCLNEIIEDERKSKISILEKALQDEDAEKERQKRENRKKASEEIDLRRPPSVSPTFNPPPRKTYTKGCFSAPADSMEYIDAGGDYEMMEMGRLKVEKPVPPIFSKGNEEKVCNEYWNGEMAKEPNGERVTTSNNPQHKNNHSLINTLTRGDDTRKSIHFSKTATGVMSVTSECLTDDSGSTGGENGSHVNPLDYALLPRTPLCPPLDAFFRNQGHQVANEKSDSNSKVEEKKRKIQLRKAKEGRNSYVVSKSAMGDSCMGELSISEIVKYIGDSDGAKNKKKIEDGREERSKKKPSGQKEIQSVATIGNQQGKAPAAAPSNKPQNNPASTPVTTKENKKSPNKKNRKGGYNIGNPAPRAAGRVSTEDGEEEFLSADEGVVSSNSDDVSVRALSASEVMMDGANYRADNDDLSCIENQVTEEQEFITVESRDKKKKSAVPIQGLRTGSTGKVERRNQQPQQQPRRNSMEDRVKPRPRPQAAVSLGDYFDEKKHDTHTKAKIIPFKEPKKKQDRLESTADSEYMDAQDEMALPTPTYNGTSTPEKGFSYADAAKKSAEQSRENSPACLNNKPNEAPVSSDTPSPPLSIADSPNDNSKSAENKADAPVSMPNEDVTEEPQAGQDSTGLSFFYEDSAFANNDEAPSSNEDGEFIMSLGGGKKMKFAMGMAAPAPVQPIDDKHRAMVEVMVNRWNVFIKQGPNPIYYAPTNVQV